MIVKKLRNQVISEILSNSLQMPTNDVLRELSKPVIKPALQLPEKKIITTFDNILQNGHLRYV
jgi:hypothetical protein